MKVRLYLFSLGLVLCTAALGQAQNRNYIRYATSNANGTEEYLYRNLRGDFFEYSSSVCPKRIKLTTVSKQAITYGETYKVKFPGKNAAYRLLLEGEGLTCTNPNGSRQFFESEDKLVSKGKNGLIEYLYSRGLPPRFIYNNNRNRKKIQLQYVSNKGSIFSMKFPGSNKIYKLNCFINGDVECTNPNGSKQLFVLED